MVNTSVMKYNTTEIQANSFSELLVYGNKFMGGGFAYGIIFIVWLVSMAALANYPNLDTLKTSSYISWLTSVLFAVFGVVETTFPIALFILVAAITAYQNSQTR